MHQQVGQAKHALEYEGSRTLEPFWHDGGRGRVQRNWKEDDVLRFSEKTVAGIIPMAACEAQMSQPEGGFLCAGSGRLGR